MRNEYINSNIEPLKKLSSSSRSTTFEKSFR